MVLLSINHIFHVTLSFSAPQNVGLSATHTLAEGFLTACMTIDPHYFTHVNFRFN